MRKAFATLAAVVALATTAVAQDVVVLTDGSTLKGRVLSFNSRSIEILPPGDDGKARSIQAKDVQTVRLGDQPLSLLRGDTAAITGRFDEAIQHYSRALEEIRQQSDKSRHLEFVHLGWAKALVAKGLTDEAVGRYRRLRFECGDCWFRSQSYLESIELLLPKGEEAVDAVVAEIARDPLGISSRMESRLLALLSSSSFEDQGKGAKLIEALGKHGNAVLESGAKSDNPQVRDWIATLRPRVEEREKKRKALEDGRRREAIQKFIGMLESDDFAVQGKAADALRKGGQAALPFLAEMSELAPREGVRKWVAKIREGIEADGKKLEEERQLFLKELAELKSSASVPPLVAAKSPKELEAWAEQIRQKYPTFDEGFGKLYDDIKKRANEIREAEKVGKLEEAGRFRCRLLDRTENLIRGGGDPRTQDAVLSALKWLAHHQGSDGSWGAETFARQCIGEKCIGPGERDYDTGVTGLALLAFLGAGFTQLSQDQFPDPLQDGRMLNFGDVVKNGLRWLTKTQDPDGCLGERGMKYMYNHAIATCAVVEAYGMTGADALKNPAKKAVDFLIASQNPGKGWRYSAKCGDNDTSVTGWAVMALKSAELSELSFPKSTYEGALNWFNEATEQNGHYQVGYNARSTGKVYVPGKNEQFDHHASMSAVAVMGRILMQKRWSEPALKAVNLLVADPPEWKKNKIDFYYWYYSSVALFQYDGPEGQMWKKWNEAMKSALVPNQHSAKSGCKVGSWDADRERWGAEGGRVYATAINALTLETYYRYPKTVEKK